MFTNSHLEWKLGGALVLAAATTAYSGWRGESIHPPAWRCLAEPGRWHGVELRVSGPVISRGEGEFTILWQDVPLRVAGRSPAAEGGSIEAVGTLDGGGPILRPLRLRALPSRAGHRWLLEAVSLGVLVLILLNFLRRFAVRPESVRLGVR